MAISFKEKAHDKKHQKVLNLIAEIEDKGSYLLVKVEENALTIQANNYSDIGPTIEEAAHMVWDNIEYIKTFIIIETFMVIEIGIRE